MLNEIADRQLLRVHHPSGLASAQVWPVTAAQAVSVGSLRHGDLVRAAVAFDQAAEEVAF